MCLKAIAQASNSFQSIQDFPEAQTRCFAPQHAFKALPRKAYSLHAVRRAANFRFHISLTIGCAPAVLNQPK
ncbi:hypothetical protein [Paraburkholderia sp. BR13444]|uniref:hypothetical protein n=1 Tax=Paraburkholderia TaxID=1822464 RepID=UPI0034CE7159